jgi:hypothetical protein
VVLALAGLATWALINRQTAVKESNTAIANESRALAALSETAIGTSNPHNARKLAIAAWPRSNSDAMPRPLLHRTVRALSKATRWCGCLICSTLVQSMAPQGGAPHPVLVQRRNRPIVGCRHRSVRLWDAATGAPIGAPMKHDGRVTGAAFDDTGRRILSWSYDGTIHLRDATTAARGGVRMKHDLKIMLAAQPVDFRKSVHTLSALVSEALRANPYCGDVFIFRSKRSQRVS